jgi:hypothetical protein
MKFIVTFKTPDAVSCTIDEIVKDYVEFNDMEGDEAEEEAFLLKEKMTEFSDRFVKYGETISIEFDMDEETATAVPVK